MQEWFETVSGKFVMAFVEGDRWKLYLKGLGVTIEIAFFCGGAGALDRHVGGADAAFRKAQWQKDTVVEACRSLY